MVLGHGQKLYDGSLQNLLHRYDRRRDVDIRYDGNDRMPDLPESVMMRKEGEGFRITYEPDKLPTAELLSLLQQAGPIHELTVQPQNIDHMIAEMYREMGL